jgi:TolB-like protein
VVGSLAPVGGLAYVDFAAAVKSALRDYHRPDLLARNPLLGGEIDKPGALAGPPQLQALLSEAVKAVLDNPRDEKLCRVIELTYFQSPLKQEAVAERLSLSFGTYRRHLTSARDRLTRWLWDSRDGLLLQQDSASAARIATTNEQDPPRTETPIPGVSEPAAPRLSLVVLPFLNIGGGVADGRLVDGITETLTTDLSRLSGVFVISRSTAWAYKNKPFDIRQVGRELGVRYALEGSIQTMRSRIRINAQLVDAESGAHLWAERFDKERVNLLEVQDEITARLARKSISSLLRQKVVDCPVQILMDSTRSIIRCADELPGTSISRWRRREAPAFSLRRRCSWTDKMWTPCWVLPTRICGKSTCTHRTTVPARSGSPKKLRPLH